MIITAIASELKYKAVTNKTQPWAKSGITQNIK